MTEAYLFNKTFSYVFEDSDANEQTCYLTWTSPNGREHHTRSQQTLLHWRTKLWYRTTTIQLDVPFVDGNGTMSVLTKECKHVDGPLTSGK